MLEHCLLLIILFMFAVRQHFSAMIHASDQYNNLYSSICYKNNTSLCYPIINFIKSSYYTSKEIVLDHLICS